MFDAEPKGSRREAGFQFQVVRLKLSVFSSWDGWLRWRGGRSGGSDGRHGWRVVPVHPFHDEAVERVGHRASLMLDEW